MTVLSKRSLFLFSCLALGAFHSARAADNGILKNIRTIETGPSLYLTPRAASIPMAREIMGEYSSVPDGKAAREVLDAALALSVAGEKAKDAVSALVRRFPRAVHVEVMANQIYNAGSGSLEDWVMTKAMGLKNRMELNPPFGKYEVIDPCSDFIEVSQEHEVLDPYHSGGRLQTASVNIRVTFVFYAGACALSRITGLNLGIYHGQWREWFEAGTTVSAPSASAEPPRPVTYIEDTPEPPAAPAAVAPAGPRTEELDFAQLLSRSPVGSRLEVRLFAGSILVGKLVSINQGGLRIDVSGASVVPVDRTAVKSISTVSY